MDIPESPVSVDRSTVDGTANVRLSELSPEGRAQALETMAGGCKARLARRALRVGDGR